MEKRKGTISLLKLCRFCLAQDATLKSIYDGTPASKTSVPLSLKILAALSIEVFPSDHMPSYICEKCTVLINICYEYKQNMCRQVDEIIHQYIHKGTPLKKVPWPALLTNQISFLSKSEPKSVKREPETVLETTDDGTVVQLSSQDISDSDEEGVINIKIGDGSDENSKGEPACIKVMVKNDKYQITKQRSKGSKERSESEEEAWASEESGRWACDLCQCTYPLQQLLTLHKRQKHRYRQFSCSQCPATFFSQSELSGHKHTHDEDTMIKCAACDKTFTRVLLLKRHEKIHHADLLRHKCDNCPESFLSLEQLETHQMRHVSYVSRPYLCNICEKRFPTKTARRRHIDVVHTGKLDYACDYCPDKFATPSKLARHVRSHAGERPYPCKYCKKRFLKSHHYTRHLRLKHQEAAEAEAEAAAGLRCDQCDESFASQDDLIYHSAIHATQNLICPLCQDKFDTVDDVTAHIKSHVAGAEFTCDFCELVFISKDKLDLHLINAHEDELHEQEMMQDESSMEKGDDDEYDAKATVQRKIVQINADNEFTITNKDPEFDEKINNTNSEESESENTYTELSTVDTLAIVTKISPTKASPVKPSAAQIMKVTNKDVRNQTASILRKAEQMKQKSVQQIAEPIVSKNSIPTSGNDKSLRLLEKELQDLKRTNSRSELSKTPIKTNEPMRSKRLVTSTPKPSRLIEEKKPVANKVSVIEKRVTERRPVTKENKEPKDVKESKSNNSNGKEEEAKRKEEEVKRKEEEAKRKEEEANRKEDEAKRKEDEAKRKEEEVKRKEDEVKPKDKEVKAVIKNGNSDKVPDEKVRRSTRPSKVKDYAKMSQGNKEEDDSDDSNDEEYTEVDQNDSRSRVRRMIAKAPAKPVLAVRKRGRPRKDVPKEVPNKVKKGNDDEDYEEQESMEKDKDEENDDKSVVEGKNERNKTPTIAEPKIDASKAATSPDQSNPSNVLVSPTGQTLKKVPVKSLPPGIKPLPLPINARPINQGELCEMQIGKKMVKVQKIVMTKAEVEAMAKKGLVEMKDGTMVLKQGIKLPTSDPAAIKSSLVGEDGAKESLARGTPMRCDVEDEN